MWLFFIMIFFPLLNLASFLTGVVTVMLTANFGARNAGAAQSMTEAQNAVNATVTQLQPFQSFSRMTPNTTPNGAALSAVVTQTGSGSVQSYPPPAVSGRIDVSDNAQNAAVYQYQVRATYDVAPLMNFSGLPLLGGVPILGTAVPVEFTATASVEHPEGLNR
ncbi:MAG: hypothetical protein U0105_07070 [Candidatus Obscuribacterales bacterium]